MLHLPFWVRADGPAARGLSTSLGEQKTDFHAKLVLSYSVALKAHWSQSLQLLRETIFVEEDFVIWGLKHNKHFTNQALSQHHQLCVFIKDQISERLARSAHVVWKTIRKTDNSIANFRMMDKHKQHFFETVCQWIHFPYSLGLETNSDLTLC